MRFLSLALFVLVLPACSNPGPPPVQVSGKVSFNQQPIKVTEGITIIFHSKLEGGKSGDTYPASQPIGEDGSFTVPGKDGKGIPAGKYKIEVQQMTGKPAAVAQRDKINEMFAKDKTQIVWEVTSETTVNLDLSKPTGK